MGSASNRPDQEIDKELRAAGLLLIALDSDQAGASESWKWWLKHYPNAKRWPVPIGKDPTEAKQAGLCLRSWILAGLPGSFQEPERSESFQGAEPPAAAPSTVKQESGTTTEPLQGQATARLGPLQSTQTEKTYKDKGSARRTVFEPFPAEWKTQFDEMKLERLAIMTVDGGLSDEAAYRSLRPC